MADYFEALRAYCLAFPGAFEDHPWGEESTVYKAANGKVFVFSGEDGEGALRATVKLTPDEGGAALTLPFVSVAKYVGRFGWVTAHVKQEAELEILLEWVGRSYELVAGTGRGRRSPGT